MSNTAKEVNEEKEKLFFFVESLKHILWTRKNAAKFLGITYRQLKELSTELGNNIYQPASKETLELLSKPFDIVNQIKNDMRDYNIKIANVDFHEIVAHRTEYGFHRYK